MGTNDDKRLRSIDSTETYAYGTSEDIIHVIEKTKRYNIMQKCLTLIIFHKKIQNKKNKRYNVIHKCLTSIKEYNPKKHSGSRKTNALLNLINNEPDIGKTYLYAKYLHEAKYQLLINRTESTGLKYLNDSKAFIEYSSDMDDIYKNIERCNPNRKRKILIVFDDMISDMLSNKKLNPIVTELFIRGRKLNISLVFITQSYFTNPKILN